MPVLRPGSRPVVLAFAAAAALVALIATAIAQGGGVFAPTTVTPVPVTVADMQALSQLGDYGTFAWTTEPQFKLVTRTDMVHIPYKGSGPAMIDLMGGQVKSMIETVPAAVSFIKTGKIRALMVTTKKRVESLPDVPTAAEAGMPGFEASSMFGMAAPAKTPKEVIDRLNAELAKILQLPDVKAKLLEQGVYATHTTPAEAAKRIHDEVAMWAKVIKDANVKVE